jgi:hypothetical protein
MGDEVGFWSMLLSAGVVIVGTIVGGVSARPPHPGGGLSRWARTADGGSSRLDRRLAVRRGLPWRGGGMGLLGLAATVYVPRGPSVAVKYRVEPLGQRR